MDNILSFLQILTHNNLYRRILTHSSKIYSTKGMKLQNISPEHVYQHFQKLQQREKQNKLKGFADAFTVQPDTWSNNQFKIFAWISICYAHLQEKGFSQFDNNDVQFLRELFPNKSQLFLNYNLKVLSKETSNRRNRWNQKEIQLFQSIIKLHSGEFKWTQISFQLFAMSEGLYFQIPQKCREQWINHLNPNVKKDRWTVSQDILLLQSVLREGKRWSSISKMFDGCRTEHMVKNRYKSIIHKNESKNKKIPQKKLCENILYYLENSLKEMQFTNNFQCFQSKLSQDCIQNEVLDGYNQLEVVEMPDFKNIVKIQTQIELQVDRVKQQQKSSKTEQILVDDEQCFNRVRRQKSWVVQLMQVQQQNTYKTHQDLFIESLLS